MFPYAYKLAFVFSPPVPVRSCPRRVREPHLSGFTAFAAVSAAVPAEVPGPAPGWAPSAAPLREECGGKGCRLEAVVGRPGLQSGLCC